MNPRSVCAIFTIAACLATGSLQAQTVVTGTGGPQESAATITTPPSVNNGVSNGVVKPAGSPSVSNGVSNGIVKPLGAPSVSNGVANGVAKSPTVQNQTE